MRDFYDRIHATCVFFLRKITPENACLLRSLSTFAVLLHVNKFKLFTMKKIILMTAIIAGCSFAASAQVTPVKQTGKANDLKTQKKSNSTKQADVLKNTSANTAIAPLILPVPKHEVDTTFLPVIKSTYNKR
jgi:hypothetical protein